MKKIRIPIKFENCLKLGGSNGKNFRLTVFERNIDDNSKSEIDIGSVHGLIETHCELIWNMETNLILKTNSDFDRKRGRKYTNI